MAKFLLPDAIIEFTVSLRREESKTSPSSKTGSTISKRPRVLVRKLIITSFDKDSCIFAFNFHFQYARQDSNLWPSAPEADALSN